MSELAKRRNKDTFLVERYFSDLVEESSSRQDHGELTGVVGVVEPGLVVDVPGVIPPGEAHDAIPGFTPHSVKTQSRREILIYRSIN